MMKITTRADLNAKVPVTLHNGKECHDPAHNHDMFIVAGNCCRDPLVNAIYLKIDGTMTIICGNCDKPIFKFEVK